MILTADFSRLAFVPEATPGTTPASPQFKVLPFSGETLEFTPQVLKSPNIVGNRQTLDSRLVAADIGGDISAALSYEANHQELFAAAFGSTWAGDVLKVGTTVQTFTFERFTEAGTTDQYARFPGCVINTMSLAVTTGGNAMLGFGILGRDMVTATTAIASSAYQDPAGNPIIAAPDVLSITLGGVSQAARIIGGINLQLSNNADAKRGLGSINIRDVTFKDFSVSGSFDVFLEDYADFVALKAQSDTSLAFTLTDTGGRDLIFTLPRIRITGIRGATAGAKGQEFSVNISFEGLYKASDLTSIMIQRSAT